MPRSVSKRSFVVGHSRDLWFVLLFATSIGIWWRGLVEAFRLALSSEAHTHILLILPLSVALAFTQRKGGRNGFESHKMGFLLLALILIGSLVYARTDFKWDPSLSMFALVTWW